MMNAAKFLVLPALLAACGERGDTGTDVPVSADVRIDGAAQDNDPESQDARMCVNEDGQIFVIWIDGRDGQPDIWFNRSHDNGTTWLPSPVMVNRGDSNVFEPAIACVGENVYVVWEDTRDGELENHQIYFSRSNDGGESWLEEDVLLELDDEGLGMSIAPAIAAVGSAVYVAWADGMNSSFDIFVASSDDNGASWGAPVRVDSDDPAGNAYSGTPQIAATDTGLVYVTWVDTRNGAGSDIYFTRSENGGVTFKEDERLDGGDDAGAFNSFTPSLSADGQNIYVVWHDARNGTGNDIYLNYSGNGGADWREDAVAVEDMVTSAPGFYNSLFPVVATKGSTGYVAWRDYRSGSAWEIFVREVAGGTPVGDVDIRVDLGEEGGFNNSINPEIALGEGGVVVVAWEDSRGLVESGLDDGYNDLYYNFAQGGAFSETDYRIDSMAPGESFKVDLNLAVHGGWLFTSWIDGRNGTADVYFKALQVGEASDYEEPETTAAAR